MTEGMKTSEFWINGLVTLLSFLVAVGIVPADFSDVLAEEGTEIIRAVFALVTAVSAGGYAVSRGLSKQSK